MASFLAKSESIEQSRRRMTFHAHDTSYSSATRQTIRIDLRSSTEDLDMETFRLVFDHSASITTGGSDTIGLQKYAASAWIREIRLKTRSGTQIGESLTFYNGMVRLEKEMKGTTDQESSFEAVMEGSDLGALASASSVAAREFAHKPMSHIFDLKNYYPVHYHDGLIIEIDMEDAENVVKYTVGSNPVYSVDNLRVVVDMVQLKPEVEQVRLQQLQESGLKVHYGVKHVIVSSVNTNLTQRFDLGTLNGRLKDIQSFTVKTTSRDVSDEDYWGRFDFNNESSYRYQLASKYLTESEVRVSTTQQAEYLNEWLKSQNLFARPMGLYGKASLTPAVLVDSKFVIGQKAERSKTDAVLSSIKDPNENKLHFVVKYSSTPATGTMYTVANLDKEMMIMPGRVVLDRDFSSFKGTF